MQEVHGHGHLVDHLELLWPHKGMSCKKIIQRSSTHVLHHHRTRVFAQPINSDKVFKFDLAYFGGLQHVSRRNRSHGIN